MKKNWTIKTHEISEGDCLIVVSNYFTSNEVVNYPLPDLKIKYPFDIGVWKIKELKK